MRQLTRIPVDPEVMGGTPCIRGLRVTVGTVVALVASGCSDEDIIPIRVTTSKIVGLGVLLSEVMRRPRVVRSEG
jgi:hypothetical protein